MTKRLRRDEVTPEEIRSTREHTEYCMRMDEQFGPGWDAIGLAELQKRIDTQRRDWPLTHGDQPVAPWASLDDILRCPERALRVMQLEDELDRTTLVVDHATGEVLEIRLRAIRAFNKMSLRGVACVKVKRDAEDWLRSRVSGRMLKGDGSITAPR